MILYANIPLILPLLYMSLFMGTIQCDVDIYLIETATVNQTTDQKTHATINNQALINDIGSSGGLTIRAIDLAITNKFSDSSYYWDGSINRDMEVRAAYIPNWLVYDKNGRKSALDFQKEISLLTHLMFAFADIEIESGEVTFSTQPYENFQEPDIILPESLQSMADRPSYKGSLLALWAIKKIFPKLQLGFSIGGAAFSNKYRKADLLSSPTKRIKIVSSIKQILVHDFPFFDFVDLDLEGLNKNSTYALYFSEILLLLHLELRDTGKKITMAIPPIGEKQLAKYPHPHLLDLCVDYFFLMMYDFAGPWSHLSDHHSSLSQVKSSLNETLQILDRKKLVLGLPTYGRIFYNCTGFGKPFSKKFIALDKNNLQDLEIQENLDSDQQELESGPTFNLEFECTSSQHVGGPEINTASELGQEILNSVEEQDCQNEHLPASQDSANIVTQSSFISTQDSPEQKTTVHYESMLDIKKEVSKIASVENEIPPNISSEGVVDVSPNDSNIVAPKENTDQLQHIYQDIAPLLKNPIISYGDILRIIREYSAAIKDQSENDAYLLTKNNILIAYNSPEDVLQKKSLIIQEHLAGAFFWELISDAPLDDKYSLLRAAFI